MRRWGRVSVAEYVTSSADTAGSGLALVTAHASSNTEGSWAELVTSTPHASSGFYIEIRSATSDMLVDIGVGSGGSEVAICNDMAIGTPTVTRETAHFYIPIPIPAGTRISGRARASTGGAICALGVTLIRGAFPAFGAMDNIATATGDSGGTSIDPGGSGNTKGAWTQLTASTINHYKGFQLSFGGNADTARTDAFWLCDIGIGAGGSEKVIVSNYPVATVSSTDNIMPRTSHQFFIPIPAGTRVAARSQCSITTAGDRLFDVSMYGYR